MSLHHHQDRFYCKHYYNFDCWVVGWGGERWGRAGMKGSKFCKFVAQTYIKS